MSFFCLQEAILFLQRLATLARSGYKGPVQQKWEATFLDMIHMLCTSNNLAQVRPPYWLLCRPSCLHVLVIKSLLSIIKCYASV